MHLIASVQWVSPHCFVLTHSIILRASLDRKGEQICNMKLWKRILKNGLLRYWLDSMKSQWCFYTWTLYPKEYLVFRIILALALHLIFFFFKISFTVKSHRIYQWVKLTSSKSTALFFQNSFRGMAWKILVSKSAGIARPRVSFKQKPFTHNTSEQMSSQWCLRKIPHVPKS